MPKKHFLIYLVFLLVLSIGAVSAAAESALPDTCQHCGEAVTWEPLTEDIAEATAISAGHYYLAFEADEAQWVQKTVPGKVCIYMNGKTVTATTSRVFAVTGELSLIGNGTVRGRGFTSTSSYGGAINVTGKLDLYGPTITTTGEEGQTAGRGGVVYVNAGELNVHSGNITGGHSANGGTIGTNSTAVVNLYGGKVVGGTTTAAGAAFYLRPDSTLNIDGGTVQGGTAGTTGGAIHAHDNSTVYIRSGSVSGGTAGTNGGSIYFRGSTFRMSGGTVTGGSAGNAGGSIYVYKGCSMEMSGGTVKSGTADSAGKCIYIPETSNITLSGDASIDDLRISAYARDTLTVKGVCTGDVVFRGTSGQADDGLVIGSAVDADLRNADYTVYNTDYKVIHDGEDIIISALGYVEPVTTEAGYCEVCQKNVEWIAYTADDCANRTYLTTGHYYLAFAEDSCTLKLKYVTGMDRVCLDLRGKSLIASNRAFDITKGILNIMDTVGGGEISGQGPTNVATVYGGTFFVRAPSTLNLYGGKLTYRLPTDGRSYVSRGGVVYVRGTLNVYGGEISGGAASAGANVYCDTGTEDGVSYVSQIGLYGGTVGSNVAVPNKTTTGKCIVTRGYATLSGNPSISQLFITSTTNSPAVADAITINGAFTGSAELRISGYTSGADIGNSKNADLTNADLSIYNHSDNVIVLNNELVGISGSPAAILFKEDGTSAAYESFADAITACSDNDKIVLMADVDADTVIDKVIHLDLNGHDITGDLSGTGTLVGMDYCTDDFTVADGIYGKLTGTVSCSVAGVTAGTVSFDDNYIMLTEADGISFHRVQLQITYVSLRPSCTGIYYHGKFAGDALVSEKVSTFGIALNAEEVPTLENMETSTLYTSIDKALWGTSSTSCLLTDIMKTDLSDSENLSRAQDLVYSKAYVQLKNGDILFGSTVSIDLLSMAQMIDDSWNDLTLVQKDAFMDMFDSYEAVMRDESWTVSNAISIADTLDVFETTDYTSYLCPWELDAVSQAKADGKIHYYFMAGEGLHISSTQTYTDKWGDACLIVFPNGQTMLIDCGPKAYAPVLVENLQRLGITKIDYLLITHPHSDHQYGIFHDAALLGTDFMELFEIGQVYWRGGYEPDTPSSTMIGRVCADLGIPVSIIEKGDVLQIGDVRMECIWPMPGEGDNLVSDGVEINSMSIVVRFDYGEHSSLFTADLYLSGEKNILECVDTSLLDVDFLKVPHHGYLTSSSLAFINAISPEVAMATGRLPISTKLRDRYTNAGIDFLDDRTNGYVEVTGDAQGVLEYVVSRTASTDEYIPEENPDVSDEDV